MNVHNKNNVKSENCYVFGGLLRYGQLGCNMICLGSVIVVDNLMWQGALKVKIKANNIR